MTETHGRWRRVWGGGNARRAVGCCLATVVLLTAAHVVQGLGWLSLIGLVPLVWALEPGRFFRTWLMLGTTAGAVQLLSLYWVLRFRPEMIWLAGPALVYVVLFYAPAAGLMRLCGRGGGRWGLAVLPAAWALVDVAGRALILRLWWPEAGDPLADWPAAVQAAALFGPEVFSFLVVAMNVAIVMCVRRGVDRWARVVVVAQGPVLLAAAVVYGLVRVSGVDPAGPRIRVGLVQPDVPQDVKFDPAHRGEVLGRLDRLIDRAAAGRPDLIVLPETAVPGYVRYEDDLTAWARGTVIRTGLPMLMGSMDFDADHRRHYNAAILITPYNTVFTYYKHRPIPVIERRISLGPLDDMFYGTSADARHLRGFDEGESSELFELAGGVQFMPMICYEDSIPVLARRFGGEGAGLLIAMINTVRFVGTAQPMQHLRRARLAAIAAGLPLVRCSNAGPSMVLDRFGRRSGVLTTGGGVVGPGEAAGVLEAPVGGQVTLYRRAGEAPLLGGLAMIAGGIALLSVVLARGRSATHTRAARQGRVKLT